MSGANDGADGKDPALGVEGTESREVSERTSSLPRYQQRLRDEEVDEAFHQLLTVTLDIPKPTPSLRAAINNVLSLIGHPLRAA